MVFMKSALAVIRNFLRSLAPIFRPPFEGLWVVILLYYAWCFFVFPRSQVLRANFPDPDDYMYLVQVMDWMKGGGWYDNIQHRLNPPHGVMIHFSRLAMIPMAGIIWLIEKCGLGLRGSSILMAIFYPLILLSGFFIAIRGVAKSFMPKEWVGLTAYIALFSTALMYMFQPGHVDHHGLVILVVAVTLLCCLRMMDEPEHFHWGLIGGILLALGLVLALEMLPWVLIIGAVVGMWGAFKGRAAARHILVFGLALHIASILGLLLTRPPEAFFTFDVLTYSIVYVFLTGGIAVSFAGIAIAAEKPLFTRLIVGVGIALITGGLFLLRFPELIGGPYNAMDPELQDLILDSVSEAMPLTEKFSNLLILSIYSSAAVMALGAGFYFFGKDGAAKRWQWGLVLALLLCAFLLTVFYQCRFGGTMGMLTVIPLAVLLQRGWGWIGTYMKGRPMFFAEMGLLLLTGPLLPVFLPALADGRSFNTGVLLFPVTGGNNNVCDTYVLEQVLRDSNTLGSHPRLIMNDMALGPELIFRTSHSALAAPFFDTEGNTDAYRFFSTPYPDEAKAIALRRHIDLVVMCQAIPIYYLRTTISQPDTAVKADFAPHFVQSLIAGHAPDWLKRVRIPGLKNFVIYEVTPQMSTPADDTAKPARP